MKTCGYCGRENSEDTSKCSECGTSLEQAPARTLPTKSTIVFGVTILIAIGIFYCLRPKGLVGRWRTDTFLTNPTGHEEKTVNGYQTLEFLKNGSFKLSCLMKVQGGKDFVISQQGTYTIADSSHVQLNFTPLTNRPDMKIPLRVSFTVSGSQLEMDAITSSVVPEKTKYRRVWW